MPARNLVSIADLSATEVWEIFHLAKEIKNKLRQGIETPFLKGKTMALLFEKPSLRTRCTFEVGMFQLGGYSIYLAPQDIGLGKRESVYDVANNLVRWVDIIVARTFAHSTVVELATFAKKIPVINALSDLEHPCQALSDFFTIWEKRQTLDKFCLAFIGDGNNTFNSLLLLSALLGTTIRCAVPKGYEPAETILATAKHLAEKSGANITITNDPREALKDCDAVYTDVWTSMGQEDKAQERRVAFKPYQVNADLLKYAPSDVLIMHCLPAHRGEEITDEVIDSPHSIVFDQAENRLHTQKGILVFLYQQSKQ
ncbi:MAG: ornithine carbamoyltransferase [Candidatus Sumerlaeia bacterium]|nr:ornithine carbamoyltransferase [Candidatus Sumerlaeia bacterium]